MSQLVTGLDHIVLVVPEIESGTAVYQSLLDRPPVWRAEGEGGAALGPMDQEHPLQHEWNFTYFKKVANKSLASLCSTSCTSARTTARSSSRSG